MNISPKDIQNLEYGEVLFLEKQLAKFIEKENEQHV